jgi:hypothetical protein
VGLFRQAVNDCTLCGLPLSGEHDGWSHKICDELDAADCAASEVHDNGALGKVERKLRRQGKCSWQIRAPGWDGGGIYCGRGVTETGGDDPDVYCLEHQCESYGDDFGAAEERNERMRELLEQAGYLR